MRGEIIRSVNLLFYNLRRDPKRRTKLLASSRAQCWMLVRLVYFSCVQSPSEVLACAVPSQATLCQGANVPWTEFATRIIEPSCSVGKPTGNSTSLPDGSVESLRSPAPLLSVLI